MQRGAALLVHSVDCVAIVQEQRDKLCEAQSCSKVEGSEGSLLGLHAFRLGMAAHAIVQQQLDQVSVAAFHCIVQQCILPWTCVVETLSLLESM